MSDALRDAFGFPPRTAEESAALTAGDGGGAAKGAAEDCAPAAAYSGKEKPAKSKKNTVTQVL